MKKRNLMMSRNDKTPLSCSLLMAYSEKTQGAQFSEINARYNRDDNDSPTSAPTVIGIPLHGSSIALSIKP